MAYRFQGMEFMKTCGCIISFRPVAGYEDSTAAPMEEVVVRHCKIHTPEGFGILK